MSAKVHGEAGDVDGAASCPPPHPHPPWHPHPLMLDSRSVKMIDLCSGLWGWSSVFAAHGWDCVGVDIVRPATIPARCTFLEKNILELTAADLRGFDFGCASTPCNEFSVFGMKHFHPNPPYPEMGIRLFNHARAIFEESGIPYVMENVRAAQIFVGRAGHHCGPFFLWGNAVPPLMNQGIQKGMSQRRDPVTGIRRGAVERFNSKKRAALVACIAPELAKCVADYADRICHSALSPAS
jgi:hypothetical protein